MTEVRFPNRHGLNTAAWFAAGFVGAGVVLVCCLAMGWLR